MVLGFFDPTGFDQLLVRATIAGSGDPTLQAIALDAVQVMLTNRPPAPIISGSAGIRLSSANSQAVRVAISFGVA